jgi:DNA polymerase-3 subunit epsilon
LDFAGFITEDKNGAAVFSFGKHKFKKVIEVLENEPGYYSWIMQADFPLYTKKVLTQLRVSGLNNAL